MLPPDRPPPDLPTPVSNGHARGRPGGQAPRGSEEEAEHAPVRLPEAPSGGMRRLAVVRLALLALSTVGVGAAFALLATGQLIFAGRVLAGDVLLIFVILMIA